MRPASRLLLGPHGPGAFFEMARLRKQGVATMKRAHAGVIPEFSFERSEKGISGTHSVNLPTLRNGSRLLALRAFVVRSGRKFNNQLK